MDNNKKEYLLRMEESRFQKAVLHYSSRGKKRLEKCMRPERAIKPKPRIQEGGGEEEIKML